MSVNDRKVFCDVTNDLGVMSTAENPRNPLKRGRKRKFGSILDYWRRLQGKVNLSEGADGVLGPMERLMQAMNDSASVYVVTRGMREVRAILTGRLVAFDRYWNLIMAHVTEYRNTTYPSLRSTEGPGRRRRRRQRRIRKIVERVVQRNQSSSSEEGVDAAPNSPEPEMPAGTSTISMQFDDPSGFNAALEPECHRHGQLFIRGANVVLVRVLPSAATTY